MSGYELIAPGWWPDEESLRTAVKMCPNIDVELETLHFLDSVQGLTLEGDLPRFGFESWLDMWRHWINGARQIQDSVERDEAVAAAVAKALADRDEHDAEQAQSARLAQEKAAFDALPQAEKARLMAGVNAFFAESE